MPKIPQNKRTRSQKKWYLHLARQKEKQPLKQNDTRIVKLIMEDTRVVTLNDISKQYNNAHINNKTTLKNDVQTEQDDDIISLHASDNDFN